LAEVQTLLEAKMIADHLDSARQALGAERAAEIDALIENGASVDELAALTDPEAAGGMSNRNLVAQYLQAKYEADGQDFTELAVVIMEQYECPEGHTVRDALGPAQRGDDERYFRDFDRNGRESYYRVGYRVKQNELVQSVENSEVSLTVGEAYDEENNTITIGEQVVVLPPNARLHMATGNEAGRADGWMDMAMEQAGDFEISNVVYDEESGAIYFIMNNGCNGNPGIITVEQGLIPLPPAPAPAPNPRTPGTPETPVVKNPNVPDTPDKPEGYRYCDQTTQKIVIVLVDGTKIPTDQDCGPRPDPCFPAGTKISMADGSLKNIEDVVVSDEVIAFNEGTGEQQEAKVLATHAPVADGYYQVNEDLLKVTDNHPLYVTKANGESVWAAIDPAKASADHKVEAIQLEVGDKLHLVDGSLIEVEVLDYVEGEVQVYNLSSIENCHTFYADGVLAHNKNEGCNSCNGGATGGQGVGAGNAAESPY